MVDFSGPAIPAVKLATVPGTVLPVAPVLGASGLAQEVLRREVKPPDSQRLGVETGKAAVKAVAEAAAAHRMTGCTH